MKREQLQIENVFDKFIKHGSQMFIAMRLAPSEEEHTASYYKFMAPRSGSTIVDLGCGIGGLGHYMTMIDPSLKFLNVVNDGALIEEMKRRGRDCIHASFEKTGIESGIADNVMFNESIGHGELSSTLKEAARLLKDYGVMTIKDFAPASIDMETLDFSSWGYKVRRPDLVISEAYKQGFFLDTLCHPMPYRIHWNEIMFDDDDSKSVLGENHYDFPIFQVLYKFVKAPTNGRA